jgi:ribose 5-phosphate isomerase A
MSTDASELRRKAGEKAVDYVQSGMVLGVGSGRTSNFFIDRLGQLFQMGLVTDIQAVPTSEASAKLLCSYGIPITDLSANPVLDLAVDGADEVDSDLNMIKGLGRALLREKIVEIHARQFLVIVDETKLVSRLGSICPLPVEILTFEWKSHISWLNQLGCRAELWRENNGDPVVTDNGNFLARLYFAQGIPDVDALAQALSQRPGILEHGLFLNMATCVLVAGKNEIMKLERQYGS